MAHSEARAWWADVQHLRDGYERTDEARRRADEADLAARRAIRERRGVEAEVSSMLAAPRRSSGSANPAPRRASGPESSARLVARAGASAALGPRAGARAAPRGPSRRAPRRCGRRPARAAQQGHRDARPSHGRDPRPHGPGARGPAGPSKVDRRRPPRRAIERVGGRPDRVAMWALLMGLLLILVAIGTADSPAVVALMLR